MSPPRRSRGPRLLERLGLHRPELRAWALYDWAGSAVSTTIIAAVFPLYYATVAAGDLPRGVATARFGIATTIALATIAILSPLLGAIGDFRAIRKRMLAGFVAAGAAAALCMFFVGPGDWLLALVLFALVNIAASGSFVFYDALLPHVAREGEMDRVSTAGYALGYVGGGLLLAANMAWIAWPGAFGLPSGEGLDDSERTLPVRLAFASVAVWWVAFSVPLLLRVPEPPRALEPDESPRDPVLRTAVRRLGETFRALRGFRHAFLMMLAFLIYNDGIMTIIRMGVIYGESLGLGRNALVGALLLAQLVGVPFAFLFGNLAARIGTKPAIFVALAAYVGICLFAFRVRTATDFFVLAGMVAMVQGGAQALSRSLFASLIPKHASAEFFSFFSIGEKFAGILGPALFTIVVAMTDSHRSAILMVLIFFVVGALLLRKVDVAAGQAAARLADAAGRTPLRSG